jgi:hypothetical protein
MWNFGPILSNLCQVLMLAVFYFQPPASSTLRTLVDDETYINKAAERISVIPINLGAIYVDGTALGVAAGFSESSRANEHLARV